MVSEVQYGGKITDDLDRRMFKTYTQVQHFLDQHLGKQSAVNFARVWFMFMALPSPLPQTTILETVDTPHR